MTITNQDFTLNNGDDYTIVFRNFDQNGNKLLLANYTFEWIVNTPSPIYKTSGVITLNELSIALNGSDTQDVKGAYTHSLVVYDFANKKYTLSKGTITFI